MSPVSESTPARKAYEAWRDFMDATQGVDGEPRRWEDMPRRVQDAFHAAAHAGAMHYANRGLGRVGQRSGHAGFEGAYVGCTRCGGHGLMIVLDDGGHEVQSPVAVDYATHGRKAMEQQEINPASGNPVLPDTRPGQIGDSRWRKMGYAKFAGPSLPEDIEGALYVGELPPVDRFSSPSDRPGLFEPLPPVDEATAGQARESAPVEVDGD